MDSLSRRSGSGVGVPVQQDPIPAPAASKKYSRRKPINHVIRVSPGFREAVNAAAGSMGVSAASLYRAAVVDYLDRLSNLNPEIARRARAEHEQTPSMVLPSALRRGE